MTWRVTRVSAPEADAAAWLEALNACFPGWGGPERFAWCFLRAFDGIVPDALFFVEEGRPVAGAGVVYRTLELADGRRTRVAVMSGAWTLPEARGRGAFTRLIAATCEAGAARGASLFVGFVTEGNVSRKRLDALGALMVPSVYARSEGRRADAPPGDDLGSPRREDFTPVPGCARFVYGAAEWRGQFVDRPGGVRAVGAARRYAALVEESRDLGILALSPGDDAAAFASLAALAARSGRSAFAFSTHARAARALASAGYAVATRGFVGFLPCARTSVAEALGVSDDGEARALLDLDLQGGDRM